MGLLSNAADMLERMDSLIEEYKTAVQHNKHYTASMIAADISNLASSMEDIQNAIGIKKEEEKDNVLHREAR